MSITKSNLESKLYNWQRGLLTGELSLLASNINRLRLNGLGSYSCLVIDEESKELLRTAECAIGEFILRLNASDK